MNTLFSILRFVLKTLLVCTAAVVLLILCGLAAQFIVPVVFLLGVLLLLKGTWRMLTPARRGPADARQ